MPRFNINDYDTQAQLIQQDHQLAQAYCHHKRAETGDQTIRPWDLDTALHRLTRRIARHQGATSKYRPHQGKKERQRRIKQGKA